MSLTALFWRVIGAVLFSFARWFTKLGTLAIGASLITMRASQAARRRAVR